MGGRRGVQRRADGDASHSGLQKGALQLRKALQKQDPNIFVILDDNISGGREFSKAGLTWSGPAGTNKEVLHGTAQWEIGFGYPQGEDYEDTVYELNQNGFFVTMLSSTGGFLKSTAPPS